MCRRTLLLLMLFHVFFSGRSALALNSNYSLDLGEAKTWGTSSVYLVHVDSIGGDSRNPSVKISVVERFSGDQAPPSLLVSELWFGLNQRAHPVAEGTYLLLAKAPKSPVFVATEVGDPKTAVILQDLRSIRNLREGVTKDGLSLVETGGETAARYYLTTLLIAKSEPAKGDLERLLVVRNRGDLAPVVRTLASQVLRLPGKAPVEAENLKWTETTLLASPDGDVLTYASYINTFVDSKPEAVTFLLGLMNSQTERLVVRKAAFQALEQSKLLDIAHPLEDPLTMSVLEAWFSMVKGDSQVSLPGAAALILVAWTQNPAEQAERRILRERVLAAIKEALSRESDPAKSASFSHALEVLKLTE